MSECMVEVSVFFERMGLGRATSASNSATKRDCAEPYMCKQHKQAMSCETGAIAKPTVKGDHMAIDKSCSRVQETARTIH